MTGILFAEPAMVHRLTYSGNNVIARNNSFSEELTDERGYLPVEWWVMSFTQAQNDAKKEGEGITTLEIDGERVKLNALSVKQKQDLFGDYHAKWPLVKVLDIGGNKVKPSFSGEPERPPIPAHVHSGEIVKGKATGKGKLEAYHFPRVEDEETCSTRLGLKPDTTKEDFLHALKEFGKSDEMYSLMNSYPVNSGDGWVIRPGVLHAPGPRVTFEMQLPQDDYNLAAWRLSERLDCSECVKAFQEQALKGLKDEEAFLNELIDWHKTTHEDFKGEFFRPEKTLHEDENSIVKQVFFDEFYGESIEVFPEKTFVKSATEKPFACIVWNGEGQVNGERVDCGKKREFLVTPNTELVIENNSTSALLLYAFFPLRE